MSVKAMMLTIDGLNKMEQEQTAKGIEPMCDDCKEKIVTELSYEVKKLIDKNISEDEINKYIQEKLNSIIIVCKERKNPTQEDEVKKTKFISIAIKEEIFMDKDPITALKEIIKIIEKEDIKVEIIGNIQKELESESNPKAYKLHLISEVAESIAKNKKSMNLNGIGVFTVVI